MLSYRPARLEPAVALWPSTFCRVRESALYTSEVPQGNPEEAISQLCDRLGARRTRR